MDDNGWGIFWILLLLVAMSFGNMINRNQVKAQLDRIEATRCK
jgi:hypothetical protein